MLLAYDTLWSVAYYFILVKGYLPRSWRLSHLYQTPSAPSLRSTRSSGDYILHPSNTSPLWELSGQPDIRILATRDWDTLDIPSPNKMLDLSHSPICVHRKKALLLEAKNDREAEIPKGAWTAEPWKLQSLKLIIGYAHRNYLIPYLVDSHTRLAASPDCPMGFCFADLLP